MKARPCIRLYFTITYIARRSRNQNTSVSFQLSAVGNQLSQKPHRSRILKSYSSPETGLTLPLPLNSWQQRQTSHEVVKEIDQLLNEHTYPQIADMLNKRGLRSGEGKLFTSPFIARIQRSYSLASRYDRLRMAGMLTVKEIAALLGICPQSVTIWNRHGLIGGHAYNDKNDCLYEPPGENPPRKAQGIKLSQRAITKVVSQGIEEVQCEA